MKPFDIEQRFKDYVVKENLFTAKDRLLVAVSGGVDSVVLCHLCHVTGFSFQIAHCNFNLRGTESNDDAGFVKQLASKYNVPYDYKEFDTANYSREQKVSIQVAARELRYAWFDDLLDADDAQLRYLLTAHHADDNVETILMNFLKGTGISGLKGIMPKHKRTVRPLLFLKKEDLLQYATDKGLNFREDSSNISEKYTRNFFRQNLIPSVEKVFPAVSENLAANADRFRDIQLLYEEAVQTHLKKLVFRKGEEVHIPVLLLKQLPARKTILFEIIKKYGFSPLQTTDALALLDGETGKYVNSATHRIYRYNKWLIISVLQSDGASSVLIEEGCALATMPNFVLHLQVQSQPFAIEHDKTVAMLDMKQILFPLVLRKWKSGDYFYPLGMRKKKKIGRFLSDEKLTLQEKENTWVLESNHRIVWIVGRRIDDRFKITDQTKSLLKIDRRSAE